MRRSRELAAVLLFSASLLLPGPSAQEAVTPQQAKWAALDEQITPLVRQGRVNEATALAEEALRFAETTLGADDYRVGVSCIRLAHLYKNQSRFADAIPLFRRAHRMAEAAMGERDSTVVSLLNDLAISLLGDAQYEQAEEAFRRLVAIRDRPVQLWPEVFAESLNGLATALRHQAKYAEAEQQFQRALKVVEGRDPAPVLGWTLNNLGLLYQQQRRYAEAGAYYRRALDVQEKLSSPGHVSTLITLHNLATLAMQEGRFREAESRYREVLRLRQIPGANDDREVANTLNSLATVYKDLGDYAQAEKTLLQALDIQQRVLKPDDLDIALTYGTLGNVYSDLGKFADAERKYKQALEIEERALSAHHPTVATTLNNLAHLYNQQWKHDEAGRLYERALKIDEQVFGENHAALTSTLGNLAMVRLEQGRVADASTLMERAFAIVRVTWGAGQPRLGYALNNLASIDRRNGKPQQAERRFLEALMVFENAYGAQHPNVGSVLWNLGNLMHASKRPGEADGYYARGLRLLARQIDEQFLYMTESERLAFVSTIRGAFPILFSFALEFRDTPALAGRMYDAVLLQKGLVASSVASVRSRVGAAGDAAATKLLADLSEAKRRLFRLASAPSDDRERWQRDLDTLEREVFGLERDLIRRSQAFADSRNEETPSWQKVRDRLTAGEAAVEFVRFPFFDGTNWADRDRYAALIVTPRSPAPALVPLGDANVLECGPLNEYSLRIAPLQQQSQGLPCPPAGPASPIALTPTFYDAFWKPLESELAGARRVYVSLDGVLNQVALNVVPDERGTLLLDKYDLRVVLSTRDLLRDPVRVSSSSAVLVGNPLYAADESVQAAAARPYRSPLRGNEDGAAGSPEERAGIGLRGPPWAPLDGTRVEVDRVGQLLRAREWTVRTYEGRDAVVEAVKAVQSPRVLHLATHGDFAADPAERRRQTFTVIGDETAPKSSILDDPMMRSGLFFTGANRYRAGLPPPPGTDDGVLTAYEASQLNLSGTELVVLSACKSGLGQSREGEGVFGLRRAFQLAGAQSVLMSMWSVPDADTQALMTRFYTNWLAGADKHAAFREAQRALARQTKDPSRWGAFVLVGR
jgi:CHAT domain-containing protein/tetratricopeptide (TPR) repeat protein